MAGQATKIKVYHGWCKKCGICIAFCPRQVLVADEAGYPTVKDPSRCTACDLCVQRCPDFAIAVFSEKENFVESEYDEKEDDEQSADSG